jgi:hypothetical protein
MIHELSHELIFSS